MNIRLYFSMTTLSLNQRTTASVAVMLIPKKARELGTGKCPSVLERWKIHIYIYSKYEKCKKMFSGIKHRVCAEVRVMKS